MINNRGERIPVQGEFYRHFKNKLYQIVAVAKHSETKEDMVIYQALYDDFGVYARPYDMFMSEVDRQKYPQVTQKYRFEQVYPPFENSAVEQQSRTIIETASETATPHELMMEFLDAESFEEKYNILVSMADDIDDQIIDSISMSMDLVIPEGPVAKRYDELKGAIRMRQHYEYSNRLR